MSPLIKSYPILRVTLSCGNFKLIYNKKDEALWVAPEKVGQPVEIPALTELFGFGSGDFAIGTVTCIYVILCCVVCCVFMLFHVGTKPKLRRMFTPKYPKAQTGQKNLCRNQRTSRTIPVKVDAGCRFKSAQWRILWLQRLIANWVTTSSPSAFSTRPEFTKYF